MLNMRYIIHSERRSKMNKKIITIAIDPYYWELFKYYAKNEGRSLSNWLERAGKELIKAINDKQTTIINKETNNRNQ